MLFSMTKKYSMVGLSAMAISSCASLYPQIYENTNAHKSAAIEKAAPVTSYEPMKPFLKFSGQTMKGQWVEDNETVVTDISYGEMILNGRAYQSTHKIDGSSYGGRTIIFYDEGAKKYIYHYFTTAGFHTTGEISLIENGYRGSEKVNGHPTIAAVSSSVEIKGDSFSLQVQYQSH